MVSSSNRRTPQLQTNRSAVLERISFIGLVQIYLNYSPVSVYRHPLLTLTSLSHINKPEHLSANDLSITHPASFLPQRYIPMRKMMHTQIADSTRLLHVPCKQSQQWSSGQDVKVAVRGEAKKRWMDMVTQKSSHEAEISAMKSVNFPKGRFDEILMWKLYCQKHLNVSTVFAPQAFPASVFFFLTADCKQRKTLKLFLFSFERLESMIFILFSCSL